MKTSNFCQLGALVIVAPTLSPVVACVLAAVYICVGVWASYKEQGSSK